MSLLFSGTNVVNFGSATSLDTPAGGAGTLLVWAYVTSNASAGTFFRKDQTSFIFNLTVTIMQLTIARATQGLLAASANFASVPTYALNKWCCFAAVWDTAGVNTDQKLFCGDLVTPLAEVTSYAPQRVGSGTVTDTTALNLVCGNATDGSLPIAGRIAIAAMWNRKLTITELQSQQFSVLPEFSPVLFSHLGYGVGTGSQWDLSGSNNPGTVTGATVDDHVPLGPLFDEFDVALYNAAMIRNPYTFQKGKRPALFRPGNAR